MGRSVSVHKVVFVWVVLGILTACGSKSTNVTDFPVPGSITLTPAGNASLDFAKTQGFSATVRNFSGQIIAEPVSFHSSNTSVLTIANSGLACAGTWDSISNPQICTAGPSGVADVTAVAKGVSSPATTVYVHQHIDSIVISPVTPPLNPCLSKDLTADYQATAFNRGVDITPTVGPFFWNIVPTPGAIRSVATVSTTAPGLQTGQARFTAVVPGTTSIFASVAGTNSLPLPFTVCPVQSISLVVAGTNSTSFTVNQTGSKAITATVVDSLGTTIVGTELTWSTSANATASIGTTGTASFSKAGGATFIASCTPPTCNSGFSPILPIYPDNPITGVSTSTSGTQPAGTLWVSSTGCGTTDNCISAAIPVALPSNTVGGALALPATPNSMVFTPDGARAYLGTDSGLLGTRGLMQLNAAGAPFSVNQFTSVVGKVLAASPNSTRLIVADTTSTPNQVYAVSMANSGSIASVPLPIAGATAADYSPDSLKAFILAGNTLYVYSAVDGLHTVPLSAPAVDVSFLSEGAFAYIAGGSSSGVTVGRTCDNAIVGSITTPATPAFIKTLPDAKSVIAADSPGVDVIPITSLPPAGCQPTATNGPVASFNLGQGSFNPIQLIVAPDGTKAYVLASNLGSIMVFDLGNQTSSAIPLLGNATPLRASLAPNGQRLYVGAVDGTVHVLDTVLNQDTAQISFPQDPTTLTGGLCNGVPLQGVVSITAASQSGTTTIYTYTLTSGSALTIGESVTITGMTDAGNNGRFTITALGSSTFTVTNSNGTTASGQTGTGNVSFPCHPDLIAVRP